MIFGFFHELCISLVGYSAICDYVGVKLSAIFNGTLLGFVINVNQAEAS